jgi:pimeloyl-ACP methyl ester carboxylesterase
MRDILVRTLAEDYTEALAAVRCPVELVWGDDDTAAPLTVAVQAQRELSDARLVVCQGAGHLTPLTVPGELRAAVERLRP